MKDYRINMKKGKARSMELLPLVQNERIIKTNILENSIQEEDIPKCWWRTDKKNH